jgi:hypothetical protein
MGCLLCCERLCQNDRNYYRKFRGDMESSCLPSALLEAKKVIGRRGS